MEDLGLARLGNDLIDELVQYDDFLDCRDLDDEVLKPSCYTLGRDKLLVSQSTSYNLLA